MWKLGTVTFGKSSFKFDGWPCIVIVGVMHYICSQNWTWYLNRSPVRVRLWRKCWWPLWTWTRIPCAVWQWLALGTPVNCGTFVCDQIIKCGAGHVKLFHLRSKFSKTSFGGPYKDIGSLWWWWGNVAEWEQSILARTSVTLAGRLFSHLWFPHQQNGDKKKQLTSQAGCEHCRCAISALIHSRWYSQHSFSLGWDYSGK